jgi:hypothetical protein
MKTIVALVVPSILAAAACGGTSSPAGPSSSHEVTGSGSAAHFYDVGTATPNCGFAANGPPTSFATTLGPSEIVAKYVCPTCQSGGGANSSDSASGSGALSHPVVQLIFWGSAWESSSTSPSATQVESAISTMLHSSYFDGLKQYGFQDIQLGQAIFNSDDPPNPYSFSDVENNVSQTIDNSDIYSGRTSSWIFLVVMPPNRTGPSNACGSHGDDTWFNWGQVNHDNVAWAAFSDLDSMTDEISHELVEAITDPDPHSGWVMDRVFAGGPNEDELGDACSNQQDFLDGVMVQSYWSNTDKACVIPYDPVDITEIRLQASWIGADLSTAVTNGEPAFPAAGKPSAYITPDGVPRIVYRGLDYHIHELRLQGSWLQADLSGAVSNGAPAFPAAGDPIPYVTPDGIPRVVYLGTDAHIHELHLQGSWIQADLSVIAAPATNAVGNPSPYVTPDGVPRVVYQGVDGHVHELRLQGGWVQADLSSIVTNNAPAAAAAGRPCPYVTPDGVPRVVYRGQDSDIHEIRLQGSWLQADLSAVVTNGAPAPAAGDPFAYVTPDRVPRIVYRGGDGHIHETRLQGSWLQTDLSAAISVGAPAPTAAGTPFAFVTPDGVPRVLYRGADEDVHELRLQGSWMQADLSQVASDAPTVPAVGDPFAYVTADGVYRVVYH